MMPIQYMNSPFGNSPNGQPGKNGYHNYTPQGTEIKQLNLKLMKTETDLELIHNLENAKFVHIPDLVKNYKGHNIPLINVHDPGLYLHVCGLEGTIYSGERFMLESWEKLYLPKPTKMEVLGILESTEGLIPFPQWVVLVGEDGCVYGYEDEELHLLASSLKELLKCGINQNGISYTEQTDTSDEEEEVLTEDEDIQRLKQKTREFIDKDGDKLNAFLSMF